MREVGPELSRAICASRWVRVRERPAERCPNMRRPPRARRRQAGVIVAKYPFALGLETELNLGLYTRLPMPSGRQLDLTGWRHVCCAPSLKVDDRSGL